MNRNPGSLFVVAIAIPLLWWFSPIPFVWFIVLFLCGWVVNFLANDKGDLW